MPLVDLCLFGKSGQRADLLTDDFVMKTITMRRFGDDTDTSVMNLLRDENEVIVLVFPHEDAMDIEEGIQLAEKRCGYNSNDNDGIEEQKQQKKMTLIFIDATWKHGREMEQASSVEWPKNLIRVQLKPSKSNIKEGGSDQRSNQDNSKEGPIFVERRFQIRTPPSPDHLSTAECLAWIVSRVEHNPHIYKSITKALDYMVAKWQQVREEAASSDTRKKKNNATNRTDTMSQKKLKIGKS